MLELTQKYLKEILNYDPDTGVLTWKKTTNKRHQAGKCADKIHGMRKNTYKRIHIHSVAYGSHRIVWLMSYGEWPENSIDHINGDGTDNRLCNLRNVTTGENLKNAALQSNNKTGANGVYMRYGKYIACIASGGIGKHIGTFKTLEEAVKARKESEAGLGFHPSHGRNR